VKKNGKWFTSVSIGAPRDLGAHFEVVAIVVDGETHKRLDRWVDTAQKTGRYPGIKLPGPTKHCSGLKALPEVTVIKAG
jgi:hypothetical protein